MEYKKEYTTPELTVVEVKSERGFASSGERSAMELINIQLEEGFNSSNHETWEAGGSLFSGDWD